MKTHAVLDRVIQQLRDKPRRWLVTGAAGFIGSHLVEQLLNLDQQVVGVDNFSNGSQTNLDELALRLGGRIQNLKFIAGDVADEATCRAACVGVDVVLHQAALGSVPRSIANPGPTNRSNVTGFLNMITAAKDAGIGRFVYASSSSVYGDNVDLPKVEHRIGKPLSPYAVTKVTNELYARAFSDLFPIQTVGLRYFNVFGPRQTPEGPYAAVIPKWIRALLAGEPVQIFGDGSTSRDFCFVKNVVQMNLLAATSDNPASLNRIFNTACNQRTSLRDLYTNLRDGLTRRLPHLPEAKVEFVEPRKGDIHHSQAAIAAAEEQLGYSPLYDVYQGLEETIAWYVDKLSQDPVARGSVAVDTTTFSRR